ncbi:alpha/beta fold hydrolase [Brevibacillus sp. SYP-B805]|uniref:alpha/beta hydrolase n=1 Tax=Brevibacillus sp. SYP-B805 TaxID=1578199 RepID=UPI0013EA80CE|nr:alpha/beta hydrolase [Brevibacillus sp. SYP-B805]NGQ95603.1 alpha/beta fold hydrolase [Brevibacillus sp. SYP-B805]
MNNDYDFISCNNPSADTIVLVHGLGLDKTTWYGFIPLLKENYHILVYDVRGHGNSKRKVQNLTWELLCDDLFQLISELNIGDFHLIGHGMGGNIGTQFAILYPERLKTLTLLSTIWFYPVSVAQQMQRQRSQIANEESIICLAKNLIPNIIYPYTQEKEEILLKAYSKIKAADYAAFTDLIAQSLNSSDLEKIKCPTLVLAGELDPIYPPYVIGMVCSYISNTRFLVIPNASNAVHLDQPQIVLSWLQEFIDNARTHKNICNNKIDKETTLQVKSHFRKIIEESKNKKFSANQMEVQLMNTFRVKLNGEEILHGWNQRKAKELFVYLLFHGRVHRETLYDIFWPELHIEKARNNLRVCLNHLKNLFKVGQSSVKSNPIIMVDREYISLNTDYTCDLFDYFAEIERAEREQDQTKKYTLFEEVIQKAPTTILAGFYEEWFLDWREKMENRIVKMTKSLANHYTNINRYDDAIRCLNIGLRFHTNDETIYEQILTLYQKNKFVKR